MINLAFRKLKKAKLFILEDLRLVKIHIVHIQNSKQEAIFTPIIRIDSQFM